MLPLQHPLTLSMQLDDEPELTFEQLICWDGNNSLKQFKMFGNRQASDLRTFKSDYILPRTFVDKFSHEVVSRRQVAVDIPRRDGNDSGNGDLEGPVVEGGGCGAKEWKAVQAQDGAKM